MTKIRNMVGRVTFMANHDKAQKTARELVLKTAALFRGPADRTHEVMTGINDVATFVDSEQASWIEPEDIKDGKAGTFDARDLRTWLLIAEKAGIPSVPAKTILTLSDDEISALSPGVAIPGHVRKSLAKSIRRLLPDSVKNQDKNIAPSIETTDLSEKLFDAMEDVPQDWMVRTHLSGSSMLKALAGTGLLNDGRDGSRLSPDIEVGAGWVRVGNRTRIDATDDRFLETFAMGGSKELHYLARPWMKPARWADGEDPHRHGSVFAGSGKWPCEWRCFIEGNRVVGVAAYYGWTGEVTPENAAKALAAADMAQKMVDHAVQAGLSTGFMDLEILRHHQRQGKSSKDVMGILERYPSGKIHATLDFIETTEGMVFLEGGPAHFPIGGGHPCAFAGHETHAGSGFCSTDGIALKLIEGVCLGDIGTWQGKSNDGAILEWQAARELAAQYVPAG